MSGVGALVSLSLTLGGSLVSLDGQISFNYIRIYRLMHYRHFR